MVEFKLGLAGEIEIYSNKRGKLAEFSNIFLDQGLNLLGTISMGSTIWVGSGNTPVKPTQTTLSNLVAKSSANSPRISYQSGVSGVAPYYAFVRFGVRFSEGQAAGNLAEIGLGTSSELMTRALIKDANGVPTTLTILPDEILDISYTVRVYAPTQDASGSITFSGNLGGTYSWVLRASEANLSSNGSSVRWDASRGAYNNGLAYVFDGPIGSVTQRPSGNILNVTFERIPYVNNSYIAQGLLNLSTTSGNLAAGIKSVQFNLGWGQYQIEFDRPIPKTNLDALSMVFAVSYGRYTG